MAVVAGVFLAARGGRSPAVKSVDFPAGEGPRTEVLVSPQWVHAAQVYQEDSFRGEPPARWGANRLVVVEAAWVPPGKRAAYDRGHVPGAVLLNTEDLETGYPAWQLRPLADLQLAIGRVGITPETTVVVYARSLLAAARVWWVLSYAGVKDVRLMGGMEHHLPPGSAGRRIDPRLAAIRDRSSSDRVAPSHIRPLTHSLNKTAARQRKHPPEIHSGQPPKMAQPSAKGPQLKPPVHR